MKKVGNRASAEIDILIRILASLVIVFTLLHVGDIIYNQFIAKPPSELVKDLNRIYDQIEILQPDETVSVFVKGKGIFSLFPANKNINKPSNPVECGKYDCLCVGDGESASFDCKKFVKFKSCEDISCKIDDFDCLIENSCIENRIEKQNLKNNDFIYICKKNNRIGISNSEDSCLA